MYPVLLIGANELSGEIIVIGIYESEEKATEAVQSGVVPHASYSLVPMKLNTFIKPRELPISE